MRCSAILLLLAAPAFAADTTKLRFVVTVGEGVLAAPTDGRVIVVMRSGSGRGEPRQEIGETGMDAAPMLGADGNALTAGKQVVLDEKSAIFPLPHLAKLPAGEYAVQAVFMFNRDLNLTSAPGNLYSTIERATIDPAAGGEVKLQLSKVVPPEQVPADSASIKFFKMKSDLLSKFHGRDYFFRFAVALPTSFANDPDKKYPVRVHVGGYGTRYHFGLRPNAQFIQILPDGAGPYGDPYQVNSANNGPYGDALTQEVVPFVEKTFRGIGAGWARVTDGTSTGGWVSLALQVLYPDFFNGCWSHAPDPVDFRAYELMNIYRDDNAYVNRHGFERPAKRVISGDTVYTVRHECQVENVLGRGDHWVTGGKDWCAWNATFGAKGADGRPVPLWEPKSGKIDRSAAEHWKKYDLRNVLQSNWTELQPKLKGKIRVWAGEADDYFLNVAVHHLDDFLRTANPPADAKITFGSRGNHGFRTLSEAQIVEQMAEAVRKAKP